MTIETDTFAVVREQIKGFAADAFKNHLVIVVHRHEKVTVYRCAQPGTGTYAFQVVCLPNTVVFYGDLGEAVLRMGDADSLGWLRAAVRSPDYLLEKVRPAPDATFYKPDAVAWVKEYAEDKADEFLESVTDLDDPHEWAGELSDRGWLDRQLPGEKHSSSMLWMVEALRWFMAHVDLVDAKAGA
jgi:hypothetical protein